MDYKDVIQLMDAKAGKTPGIFGAVLDVGRWMCQQTSKETSRDNRCFEAPTAQGTSHLRLNIFSQVSCSILFKSYFILLNIIIVFQFLILQQVVHSSETD